MSIDTIAARNKRLKVLEAQRADDAATIKGLVKQIAELEDELRRRQEIIDDARIRMDDRLKRAESAEARVTLADRLAEAVRWWVKFTDRESFFPDDGEQWEALDQEIREALAAYYSPRKEREQHVRQRPTRSCDGDAATGGARSPRRSGRRGDGGG